MLFRRSNPLTAGLISSIVLGLVVGLIVSLGSRADVIEMLPGRCQDRVIILEVANSCPPGTYLELIPEDDTGNGGFIICRCAEPSPPILLQIPGPGQVPHLSDPPPRAPIRL